MNSKTVFSEIQPLCIEVAKKADLRSVQNLEKYLENVLDKENSNSDDSISVLNDLKEYIAFPLVLILKNETFQSKGQEVFECVFRCLGKVLSSALYIEWSFFYDVFSLLFRHITSENPQTVANISEESKIEILRNVINLCLALSPEHWAKLCSSEFRPQLGHAVYICLRVAEKEKNRNLRLIALETIQELGLKQHWNQLDTKNTHDLGSTFANFLPGIAMATTRIAMSGEIQGHRVVVAALNCWDYYVTLVMRDKFLASVVEDFGIKSSMLLLKSKLFPEGKKKRDQNTEREKNGGQKLSVENSEKEMETKLRAVSLDVSWVESTSEKLLVLAKCLVTLVSHSHWRVRLTLISFCQSLVQHCPRSLNNCMIPSLEALITLKSAPELEVSESAEIALRFFMELFVSEEDNLMELLEERIFCLCTSLPTVVKTQDDAKILSCIQQLNGSLEVLGEKIDALTQVPSHLQRLLRSLMILFTYDYSNPDLLMEKLMTDDSLEVMPAKSRLGLSFRYFRNGSILRYASGCCSLIGRHGNLNVVVDQILDMVQESVFQRSEAILVLNFVIKGAINQDVKETPQEREKIVDAILGVLVNLEAFEAPLSVGQDSKSAQDETQSALVSYRSFKPSVSVDLAKRNVIFVSNSLQMTGTCAVFLQKDFTVFLNRILCSVMEKAGENNVLVSYEAIRVLEDLSAAGGHQSIAELVDSSVPVIWFPLSQKLKRLPDFPSSPQVLKVALRCYKGEVKTFVEGLVEDVLDSLDAFHTESPLPLLTVLLSFVDALAVTNSRSKDCQASSLKKDKTGLDLNPKTKDDRGGSLRGFLESLNRDYEELKRRMDEEAVEVEEDPLSPEEGFKKYREEKEINEDPRHSFEEEEKKQVPKQISLVSRILEKCCYLLFVKERKLQLVIIQIIQCCCLVLNDWENEKFPCFHKIWKPLVLRLKDKDFVVLLKALETCVLMVKSSGDFLRRRFIQELLPSLVFFLESQSSASLSKTRKSGYYLTPAFKAQCHVLENVPSLLQGLALDVLESSELLDVILLYTDDRQPPLLGQLSLNALQAMADVHADLVWLAVAHTKGAFRIIPPSPLLHPIIINGRKREHVNQNVYKLFDSLS